MAENRLIEVKMTKTTLYFTEAELVSLLRCNPTLWEEAIRRGKAVQRQRAAERRGESCSQERC